MSTLDETLDDAILRMKLSVTPQAVAIELKQRIEALLTEARIDELERLYIVNGTMEQIFSLAKKGDSYETPISDPIENRLTQLKEKK